MVRTFVPKCLLGNIEVSRVFCKKKPKLKLWSFLAINKKASLKEMCKSCNQMKDISNQLEKNK
jgi:hypothetical protein